MNYIYDSGTYYDSDIYSTIPSSGGTSDFMSLLPLLILGVFLVVFMAYYIFAYVMQAISFQTIARRRGIAHPWLAWIPFATNWLFGAIVSDYDKRNGINRRWDKILLTLSIVLEVFAIVVSVGMFVAIFAGAFLSAFIPHSAEIISIILLLVVYTLYILLLIFASTLSTLVTVCVFKLFESTVPDKALTYFLFYLLVPFAAPICLFACRNKGYEVLPEDDLIVEQVNAE